MRDLRMIIIITVIAFAVFFLLTGGVHAAESNITIISVKQGDTIYWGDICDLSEAAAWPSYTLAWWQGDVDGSGGIPPDKIVDVSSNMQKTVISSDKFPLGTWYRWDGAWHHAENMVAFDVEPVRPKPTLQQIDRIGNRTYCFGLYLNKTANTSGYVLKYNETDVISICINRTTEELSSYTPGPKEVTHTEFPKSEYPLPSKHVSDYLISRGYPFTFTTSGSAHIWIVSKTQNYGIYPTMWEGNTSYSADQISVLLPGDYRIVVQEPGASGIYDLLYDPNRRVMYSPFSSVSNISTSGILPCMIADKAEQLKCPYCDDVYTEYNLTIANQEVDIRGIESLEDYFNRTAETNRVRLTGYTTLPKGAELKIILDYDQQNMKTINSVMKTTIVFGDYPGDMRQFDIVYPIDYDNLQSGGKEHYFTIITPSGATGVAPFHIIDIPVGSEPQKAFNKYMMGNFTTPTPEVIILPSPSPEIHRAVVYVTVTPDPTPTPSPPPFYTEYPWSIVIAVIATLVIVWLIWRFGPW